MEQDALAMHRGDDDEYAKPFLLATGNVGSDAGCAKLARTRRIAGVFHD